MNNSQLTTHNSQLTTHNSQLTTHNSQKLYPLILLILFSFNGIGQIGVPLNTPSLITTNTTWSNPIYYIYDDVVISGNVTLTIDAGVQLIFGPDFHPLDNVKRGDSAKTGIFVEDNGAIIVNGTETDKVTMTALFPSTGWEGISIEGVYDPNNLQNGFNQLPSHINHCIIENVIKETDGKCNTPEKNGSIYLEKYNNIIIENSIIRNNIVSFGGGIMIIDNGQPLPLIPYNYPIIRNNQIHNNTARRGGAICVVKAASQSPFIHNNEIYDNTALTDAGGIGVFLATSSIHHNHIYNNTAECQDFYGSNQRGGGGIVIGLNAFAEIIGNTINNNTAMFVSSSTDETGLGGGILVRHTGNAEIKENEIIANDAENGGGIAVYTEALSTSTIASNIFAEGNNISGNIAYNNGGGVVFKYSYGELLFNDIYKNAALSEGGGLYIFANRANSSGANIPIKIYYNNIFSNIATNGGAIFANGDGNGTFSSTFHIINNLLYSNISEYDGAAIYLGENWFDIHVNNNTIVKNESNTNPIGNAVFIPYRYDYNNYSFVNNIMYFNQDDCQVYFPNIRQYEFLSNDILHLNCLPPNIIDDNYDFDPEFIDYENNQFELSPSSQLIDLGNQNVNPIGNYDISMAPRIQINQIDIGAYEFNGSYINITKDYSEGTIYPNPASKQITIKSDVITENSIIEIYSADSKLLIKHKSYQNNRAIIEIDKLPNGLYFIKVISENEVFTDKFIKE